MCLNVFNGNKPRIARRNIAVYKELLDGRSFYKGFLYKPFKRNPEEKFHVNCEREVEKGYHSRTSESKRDKKDLFIIPKGSKIIRGRENNLNFHLGLDGFVSSNIIYVGENTLRNRVIGFLIYGVIFHSEKYLNKRNVQRNTR